MCSLQQIIFKLYKKSIGIKVYLETHVEIVNFDKGAKTVFSFFNLFFIKYFAPIKQILFIFFVKYEYLFQALDPNQFQKTNSDSSLLCEDDFLEAERFCALRNMSHQVQNRVPDAHCTPALRNKTHHHGAEQMHTHVNEQLNLGKSAFKKKKMFSGGFVVVFFCYPAYAALVNSQWVPSFKHMKRLGERLILQESKNRPNVFCCERFVETK